MKVTFYLPNLSQLSPPDELDPFAAWKEKPRGEGFWILQTYCLLRHYGLDVHISDQLPSDGILVFHRRNRSSLFRQSPRKLKKLVLVGCRGDLHALHIADFELLQNRYFEDGRTRFMMPHWPMPGIRPRDPNRGPRLKSIAFKGFAKQLHNDFQTAEWKQFLDSHGIEWIQDAVAFTHEGGSRFDESQWNDYRNVDAILAVRPDTNQLHTNKPALKLYNAWHAGVVPLLGPEIAYREVGENGVDYLEVCNLGEARAAIEKLVNQPDLFQRLIDNGQKKAHHYTHAAVAQAWDRFLNQTIPEQLSRRRENAARKLAKNIPIGIRYHLINLVSQATFQRTR